MLGDSVFCKLKKSTPAHIYVCHPALKSNIILFGLFETHIHRSVG